jgi:drug/metabolite transporter (DMT)-like permease
MVTADKKTLLKKILTEAKSLIIPLAVMALWGSLFPFIKIGYSAFGIDSSSIPDILMFAAFRFTVCGAAVCGFSVVRKEKLAPPKLKSVGLIVMMGFFGIVLHYAFTYIGLSFIDASKTALIKQLGALLYVCFAFLFVKSEKYSTAKIIGAVLGFSGIIAINFGSDGISFDLGSLLILMASVCSVVSSVMSAVSVKDSSPFWVTGISQITGGVILLAAGFIMGGDIPDFNLKSTLVFAYICLASIIAYTLWYYCQRKVSLSKLFIIKFAEPLFACVFGAILLGEEIFKIQYLIAFVLISAGIVLGNKEKKKSEPSTEKE